MPFSEKVTLDRTGSTAGVDIATTSPQLATYSNGLYTIYWGTGTDAIAGADTSRLGTGYQFTMSSDLTAIFIPNPNFAVPSVKILPRFFKTGEAINIDILNHSTDAANMPALGELGKLFLVEGKPKLNLVS